MKTGKSIVELAEEIIAQNSQKHDYLLDTSCISMQIVDDRANLFVDHLDERLRFSDITETAHSQIANVIDMPMKYYNRCLNGNPQLLMANVNSWLHKTRSTKMLRTLGDKARALLSDRYKRIDNYDVFNVAYPIINEIPDARCESAEITETKMYLKIVNPRLEAEVVPGDIVQSGLMISNSEVGKGRLMVQPLIYRLVCKNGLIVNDAGLKKYHIGREEYDDDAFSDETRHSIDRTFLLKIKDAINSVTDEIKFGKFVETMRDAKEAKIEGSTVQGVVELAGSQFGWGKNEGEGILDYLVRGGDLSLYGLASAITRYSQDVDSYEKATELETIGYDVMTISKSKWNAINNT